MEEIEVGEYVRTIHGEISKLLYKTKNDNGLYRYVFDNHIGMSILKFYIKKHSKDITDLIEKDDYINGCRVYEVEERGITVYQKVGDSSIDYNWITKDEIQTILTHEQYENNVYRIGE